jgi:adenine phosphoribosyltransferase
MNLKDHIRSIPDFPKPGILFYDISTLLQHAEAWKATVDRLAEEIYPYKPDRLIGVESRGFLVAAPLAVHLGIGFTMVRKQNKLPGETISFTYELEYGSDTIEIQSDALQEGQKVVLMDDLLATGGTAAAAVELLRSVGGDVVASAFIIELNFLNGRNKLDVPVHSLIGYDD